MCVCVYVNACACVCHLHCRSTLVPVYGFGENELFDQPKSIFLRKFQRFCTNRFGMSYPFFQGQELARMLPYRRALHTVGKCNKRTDNTHEQWLTLLCRGRHSHGKLNVISISYIIPVSGLCFCIKCFVEAIHVAMVYSLFVHVRTSVP